MKSILVQSEFVGVPLSFQNQMSIEAINCRFADCVQSVPFRVDQEKYVKIFRCLLESSVTDYFAGFYFSNIQNIFISETSVRNTTHINNDNGGIPIVLGGNSVEVCSLNITCIDSNHISGFQINNAAAYSAKYINDVDCYSYSVVFQFLSNTDDGIIDYSNIINSSSKASVYGLFRAVLQDQTNLNIKDCYINSCQCNSVFCGQSPIYVENCCSSDYTFIGTVNFGNNNPFVETLSLVIPWYYDTIQLCNTYNKVHSSTITICILLIFIKHDECYFL